MRPLLLVAAAVLAACASTPSDSDGWPVIQRDRLERLHGPRNERQALAAVLAQDPSRGAQDGRHLDQREPQARSFHGGQLSAHATIGFGDVAAKVDGTPWNDRADARFLEAGLEASNGAGLHVNLWNSEAELFAGRRINDGTAPAAADGSMSGADAFPHQRWDVLDGALRLPVRLGVFGDWQTVRHEQAGVEREWISAGPRLLLEPTWRVLGDARTGLDLVGRLGGDAGGAWFKERFHGGDDRDFTVRWTGEAGLGLRGLAGRWQADLGYRVLHTTFGSIDSDLFGDRHRTELQRQQVFVGLGVTW